MAMKRCPVCGEKYSDTYRDCPFCEEEEALQEGEEIRRTSRKGRRVAHGRHYNMITPTLIVLILIMAGLLIYLLYGDKLAEKFGGKDTPEQPGTEEVTPGVPVETEPDEPDTPDEPDQQEDPEGSGNGVMPEDPDTPDTPDDTPDTPNTPDTPTEPDESGDMTDEEYEAAAKLPDGLTISTEDFTLRTLGETAKITVSGGSGSYEWISEDPGIATVDQSGKVTAVSNGTINVLVTDGSKKAVCIVRVRVTGTSTGTPSSGDSSSTLQAGAAVVVNGGNGVRVRSGPGTDYEILATIPNGGNVRIIESAGNDWYKITFSNVGGVTTPGYMKGEFLTNQ